MAKFRERGGMIGILSIESDCAYSNNRQPDIKLPLSFIYFVLLWEDYHCGMTCLKYHYRYEANREGIIPGRQNHLPKYSS